jgi:flagellar protein FlaF
MSPREVEASVLTKAAMMLKECQDNWDASDREARLQNALRHNQLIWSVFQSELSKEENPLPKKLKEDILSLSAFIDKRIFEIMAHPTSEKLAIIISINLNLAAGLRVKPE